MDNLSALASFAFVSSVTPGPNNILLAGSGIRFGFARTVPHIIGIQLGVATQLALCSLGLGSILLAVPGLSMAIRLAGSLFLLYLVWRLCQPGSIDVESPDTARPFTLLEALLFQFLNPKAWVMTLTVSSIYDQGSAHSLISLGLFCGLFCLVSGPSSGSWALLGAAIQSYWERPHWRQHFNALMAILTLYCIYALWQ